MTSSEWWRRRQKTAGKLQALGNCQVRSGDEPCGAPAAISFGGVVVCRAHIGALDAALDEIEYEQRRLAGAALRRRRR